VFLQDVLPKHFAGDVREVSGGYARNYLIPHGLAAPALGTHLQHIDKIKHAAEGRRARETQDMEKLAKIVGGTTVTIKARAGESGRLYGSVTNARIAEELSLALGREIDRRAIQMPDAIKEVGTFEVPVRLYHNIIPEISVIVEAEGGMVAEVEAPDEEEEEVDAEPVTQEETLDEPVDPEATTA
jgi:large subunit ribosomal protein L9